MARPIKKGLDYFPLNVFLTGSVEYIECMYGAIGVYVIISLWKRIYEHSYYYKYDEKTPLICSKEFGNQLELCFPKKNKQSYEIYDEIVKKAVEFGVFDKGMFEKYSILTSKTIQKIYSEAKRKDARELIDERYLLINIPENGVFAAKTNVIAAKTPINAETIPQSKVKKSKVKESKAKESKVNESKVNESNVTSKSAAVLDAYEKYIGKVTPLVADDIDDFLNRGVESELIIRIIEYACERNARSRQYIWQVIINNLNEGITTLDAYNRKEAERRSKRKPPQKTSKFNNYQSENNYADLEERLLDNLLKEDGE